jgi:hypothetical protein
MLSGAAWIIGWVDVVSERVTEYLRPEVKGIILVSAVQSTWVA